MDHKESDMTEQLRTQMAVTYNKGMYPLLQVSLVTCIPCYMYPLSHVSLVKCTPCYMYMLQNHQCYNKKTNKLSYCMNTRSKFYFLKSKFHTSSIDFSLEQFPQTDENKNA